MRNPSRLLVITLRNDMAQGLVGAKGRSRVAYLCLGRRGYRPRGLTAPDCALIAVGAIEGKTFQGEIKYIFDNRDSKAALDYLKGGNSKPNDIDVEAGHKITITFAPQSATLRDDQGDISAAGCTDHHGLFGRFTKRRK